MIALVLFLVAAGLDRLLISERWPLLDRPRRRWREWRPRVLGYLRSAPGTYIYLFVLLITSWVLQTSSGNIANALLLERSSNLHQLARDPVRVLFSSAFWVGGFGSWLVWFVLLSLSVAPVERWIGTARTALVFVIGHVGATLVTAAGLSIALRSDLVESSVVDARDVGASYGFAAVVAVLAYRFPIAPRLVFAAIVLAGAGGQVALDQNFTNWGHIIALAFGSACYPLTKRRQPRQRLTSARSMRARADRPPERRPEVGPATEDASPRSRSGLDVAGHTTATCHAGRRSHDRRRSGAMFVAVDGDGNGTGAAEALERPGILLRGSSIVLRAYRPDELDRVHDARARSKHSVGEPDPDWLRQRIENSGGWFEGQLDLAIEGAGQLVGTLEARAPLRAMPPGVCEIGIEIFEEERGKGLGTEAIRLFSEWLLDSGYPRVQASTDLRNAHMRRSFEKLGWEFEGVLRAFMPDGGGRADYALYSLTRVA